MTQKMGTREGHLELLLAVIAEIVPVGFLLFFRWFGRLA
jgi:hypothetical protein